MSIVKIRPKLMTFCEYLHIFRPQNRKNRKPGHLGFEAEKPDLFKWKKPGCHH